MSVGGGEGWAGFRGVGRAAKRRHAAADDAKGFAGGVIVDGTHHQPTAGRRFAHRFMLTQPIANLIPSQHHALSLGYASSEAPLMQDLGLLLLRIVAGVTLF